MKEFAASLGLLAAFLAGIVVGVSADRTAAETATTTTIARYEQRLESCLATADALARTNEGLGQRVLTWADLIDKLPPCGQRRRGSR